MKPLTDALKIEVQESHAETAMWKAKFEGFERKLTAFGVDINLTERQKLAGVREEEWKEIEDCHGDFTEWQPELLSTYEAVVVDEAEVMGKAGGSR